LWKEDPEGDNNGQDNENDYNTTERTCVKKKEQIEPPDRDVASMFRPTRVVTGIIKPGISLNGLVGCPLLPVHS